MPPKSRGRPRKKARKTPQNEPEPAIPSHSWRDGGQIGSYSDFESDLEPEDDETDVDECEGSKWSGFEDEEFTERLAEMAEMDDPNDTDWIPPSLRTKKQPQKDRPPTYKKGPDVMSKSRRTQQRYKATFANQSRLDSFIIRQPSRSSSTTSSIPHRRRASERDDSSVSSSKSVEELPPPPSSPGSEPAIQPNQDIDIPNAASDDGDEPGDEDIQPDTLDEADQESWEHELDLGVQGTGEIKGWDVLRTQIKADLKKNHKRLALTQINQLIILSNFATLRLKGASRIRASEEIARQWHEGEGVWFARRVRALARHYQVFEQLPIEHRGGYKNARTLLCDERVKKSSLDFLQVSRLPSGKVTPKIFQNALNTTILPDLGITTARPLCKRTAARWLIKLGWRHTLIRKGVYMDGHERVDVVEYRQNVFLPAMAKYEARMTHYEGPDLIPVPPNLQPGEKEVVPNFHDESSFHGNESMRSAWLRAGEQPLRKKSRGRIIHVSAFINPITGRLILLDADGNVVRDSMKIIYPGSNGDPWWDCAQLLQQMGDAIDIFEAAHPNKISLFIFDQSSAHASLPPDALKAFEMNKSNGGRQRRQRDTVIPMNNPTAEHRGKEQKMTLPDGRQKGLQRTLEERGFKVSHLRAKCAPVCPIENQDCCMARLLSQQDDFKNQISMLESYICGRGHEYNTPAMSENKPSILKENRRTPDKLPAKEASAMPLDPDNPYFFEHAYPKPDGDLWEILLKPELEADTTRCDAWKDEVQNLLIFAGLFSAVVTTFIIESYKFLQPDPNATIVGLLFHIANSLNNTSPLPPSFVPVPFSPTSSSVRINIFWFISLILSLTTVLVGTISLQWLREHQSYPDVSFKEKLAIFHMRSEALDVWRVPQIFSALPVLLQAALALFLIGLIDFILPLGRKLTIPVSIIIALTLFFLAATTALPTYQGFLFLTGFYPYTQPPSPAGMEGPTHGSPATAASPKPAASDIHVYARAQYISIFKFVANHLSDETLSNSEEQNSGEDTPSVLFYLTAIFLWRFLDHIPLSHWGQLKNADSGSFGQGLVSLLETSLQYRSWTRAVSKKNEVLETRFAQKVHSKRKAKDIDRFSEEWWDLLIECGRYIGLKATAQGPTATEESGQKTRPSSSSQHEQNTAVVVTTLTTPSSPLASPAIIYNSPASTALEPDGNVAGHNEISHTSLPSVSLMRTVSHDDHDKDTMRQAHSDSPTTTKHMAETNKVLPVDPIPNLPFTHLQTSWAVKILPGFTPPQTAAGGTGPQDIAADAFGNEQVPVQAGAPHFTIEFESPVALEQNELVEVADRGDGAPDDQPKLEDAVMHINPPN
ncbi:hypothetical protein BJ912DRAFT_1062706 [Pholiota molesta]|nr:hypothetical protein BJ912DRAFT_1062706 [Pholiota molesta]